MNKILDFFNYFLKKGNIAKFISVLVKKLNVRIFFRLMHFVQWKYVSDSVGGFSAEDLATTPRTLACTW